MSRSLNEINLIGNVGGDPDVRTTPSGTRIAKCSLATSRPFKDKSGQQQEKTQWHRLTFFGKVVDVVESWVKKGDRLYVKGRVEYSQTEDQSGNVRYWTDIIVFELIMLGGDRKQNAGATRSSQPKPSKPRKPITEPDDDLPF